MKKHIAMGIQRRYPNAAEHIDYLVLDNSDGRGPFVAKWNTEKLGDRPSDEMLEFEGILESGERHQKEQNEQQERRSAKNTLNVLESMTFEEFDALNMTQIKPLLYHLMRREIRRLR